MPLDEEPPGDDRPPADPLPLTRRFPRPRLPRWSRSRDHDFLIVALLVFLIGAGSVAAALVFFPATVPSSSSSTQETLYATTGVSPYPVSPGFWGANVGVSNNLTGPFTAQVALTHSTYFRWPGGAAGDGMNYTSGLLTNTTTGAQNPVAANLSNFVSWCDAVGCRAILELPGEIDSPSTAAYYVNYTENTLRFHPDYWEIGNEPAIWTHFQIPWSKWGGGQAVNATPSSYALLVRQYVQAIHRVDPAAPIIGLGGVGTGAYGEASWITATVAENGPNLSAVAIHVYPAGTPPSGTATLAQFFSNVTGAHSLAVRVPADRAAIRAACIACPALALLVTEYGSASSFGSFSTYAFGYPQVPFIASEVIQGLDLDVSQMYLRQVETPHAGSWIDGATGYIHPLFALYSELLLRLGSTVLPSTLSLPGTGFFAAVTYTNEDGPRTILVDNANVTTGASLQLDGSLGVAGPVSLWSWNQTSPGPVETNQSWNSSTRWIVPPLGLLMIRTSAPLNVTPTLDVDSGTLTSAPTPSASNSAGPAAVPRRVVPVAPATR